MTNTNAATIGQKLVSLVKEGKAVAAVQELYADDIVSVEATDGGMGREQTGKQAVLGKNKWWEENHEVHKAGVEGPFPHGEDRFAVIYDYEVTFKPEKRRQTMQEVGVYTVANGKVVREEFFYNM